MTATKTKASELRTRLSHPVIDGDGHLHEYLPVLMQFLAEAGGTKLRERYMAKLPAGSRNFDGGVDRIGGPMGWNGLIVPQQRHEWRVTRPPFWGLPANTYDRATLGLPKLLNERLPELGIDFTVLYPTQGLEILRESEDEELRRMGCRAFNKMAVELFGPYPERMTVPAMIPMGTPQEAIEELDYAVGKLGMKAIVIGSLVRRRIAEAEKRWPGSGLFANWIDVLAYGSEYDYDPFWKRCVELKVAVTAHSGAFGVGLRSLPESFVYNHIGHFAEAGEAFCKAVVLGGVAQRFPELRFAFLEGGVGWACALYNNLIEHWQKRNLKSMLELLDPTLIDKEKLTGLYRKWGGPRFERELDSHGSGQPTMSQDVGDEDPASLDEFKTLKVEHGRDFKKMFENFYFGCEADDRMTAVAFNPRINRYKTKLHGFFSSDIGHFDVPDITETLLEAFELVDDELLNEEDFRDFTFTNAARLFASQNPDFFSRGPRSNRLSTN